MIEAVIFDVDGTLVDSVDLHAQAWQDAFGDFKHTIEFGKIREQIGKGGDQLLPVFLSPVEIDAIGERLEKHRGEILKSRYMNRIGAFPQVRALFQKLLAEGKQVALASSAKQAELEHYKEVARIADLIQTQTSSDDAEHSKPHPDIFQAAMKRLPGVAPGNILVVGDTPYDAQAATKAGLRTIGMLCGGFTEASLRQAGCIAIYRDPADLLANYAGSPIAA